MLRTHSSIFAMSVSSSQGFTSSKMDDFAMTVAFFALSMSSSSSLESALVVSSTPAGPYCPRAFFTPGRLYGKAKKP
uniref:Uncharacterized protein n=1 Tax=Scleropages formosus TaxID=113540 RepID=A0A8C9RQY5_SCLFO